MSVDENKYTFELCKRRGIKAKLHPIVTDFKLLRAMTVKKNTEARSKATRQKAREVPLKSLGKRTSDEITGGSAENATK
ncbi:predicted protein [Sclerotinia sclerotiorum 1980 UF-70]|uniref:Uncharacterized protein n=1 Tax=Sclerotinia sclerotiorum (strain ATCC 18683 / 1980 / Ss-1) TaxID=665079 RepID=A7EYP8_SCLS1|nr:predicted protein [Sclerotinia sclerotiorum 1980 UF-70]EDN94590.1 predicted protein [Sclerotinia sclerotiorum 1980 UF-70]